MTTRRHFLKTSASAVAAGLIIPSSFGHGISPARVNSISPARVIGANDRINVGLIGCKNMGWADLGDFLLNPNVECTAICDIDKDILDNRAIELQQTKNKRPEIFGDYRKMLELKDLDIVIIGTPDHWHCLQFVDACAAGKDVYVEKPIANYISECDIMVKAAKRYERVTTVGQQQRSGDHWKNMIDYINSGKLGTISRVDVWANFSYGALSRPVPDSEVPQGVDFNTWLGPAKLRPFNQKRFHGSWRMFWDYGGGLMTDWGVHLLDMALWGMNVDYLPKRIVAVGGKYAYPENCPETFDTQNVTYEFDSFIMNWSHTSIESGIYNRNYGVAFKGTNGTLVANREGWEILPEWDSQSNKGKIESLKEYPSNNDHKKHVDSFLDCVKSRSFNTPCTIENGSLCAKYAHLGNIAARTRSVLQYDNDKQKFIGNKDADLLLKPAYRSPWKLPSV